MCKKVAIDRVTFIYSSICGLIFRVLEWLDKMLQGKL